MLNGLIKIADFITRFIKQKKLLNQDKRIQEKMGYKIEIRGGPGGSFVTYEEGDFFTEIAVDFTWDNLPTLYIESIDFWFRPKYQKIPEHARELILNRLKSFLSTYGSITYDNSPMTTPDDIKKNLDDQGISYQEKDGLIVYKGLNLKKHNKTLNL